MFERIAASYQDSMVVVIGAGGIGSAIMARVAGMANKIVVADYDPASLRRIKEECGVAVHTFELDVRDSQAVERFFREVRAVGVPHFLFYTVGVLTIEPFLATRPEQWDRSVAINLNGAFYCARQAAELMVAERRGSILLLGSIAGTKARSGTRVNPVYNATKAAIAAFVNSAAMHLRPYGVRINSIAPGPTSTTMMNVQPQEVHTAIQTIMLDGRMNQADEVAELALFVAAHDRFSGEDIALGGGAGLGG